MLALGTYLGLVPSVWQFHLMMKVQSTEGHRVTQEKPHSSFILPTHR